MLSSFALALQNIYCKGCTMLFAIKNGVQLIQARIAGSGFDDWKLNASLLIGHGLIHKYLVLEPGDLTIALGSQFSKDHHWRPSCDGHRLGEGLEHVTDGGVGDAGDVDVQGTRGKGFAKIVEGLASVDSRIFGEQLGNLQTVSTFRMVVLEILARSDFFPIVDPNYVKAGRRTYNFARQFNFRSVFSLDGL